MKLYATSRAPGASPAAGWRSHQPHSRNRLRLAARGQGTDCNRGSGVSNDVADAAGPAPPLLPPLEAVAKEQPLPRQDLQQQGSQPLSDQLQGLGYLLIVAMLWGSYTPAVRLAYTTQGPPTPTALTAASAVVELLVLLAAALLTARRPAAAAAAPGEASAADTSSSSSSSSSNSTDALAPLPLGLPAAALAGLEIGLYNSAASFAQIAGLSLTTATRGAFLVQASTLFTPVLSNMAGMAPSSLTWAGSVLAFCGTLVITQDHTSSSSSSGSDAPDAAAAAAAADAGGGGAGLPLGDALTLFAALCYSAATVRMPAWAVRRRVEPLQLALGKCAVLTAVALAALGVQAWQLAADGQSVVELWPGWLEPQGWAAVLWAALGPGALASVLHVKGQTLVSPTAAQIVFCTVPVWSALLAAAELPGEAVGPVTLAGGAVVAAAGVVASLPSPAAQQPTKRPAERRP